MNAQGEISVRFGVVVAGAVAAMSLAMLVILSLAGAVTGELPLTRVADVDWTLYLKTLDAALAAGKVDAAVRALREAHVVAFRSGRWEAMLAVGDAGLRIGELSGQRALAVPGARKAYLRGLFQARDQRSLDGVLRFAEAFAALGDREVVEQCIGIADRLAAGDREGRQRARVQAFTDRFHGASGAHGGVRLQQF